jgi:hypothetical protein
MPQFEIKNVGDNDWQKISEKVFLTKLIDNFETISPILIEMFQGKEILSCDSVYRIQDT